VLVEQVVFVVKEKNGVHHQSVVRVLEMTLGYSRQRNVEIVH
jgi:hypothetical protein